MSTIPKRPLYIFVDHAFEAWFSLGMVILATGGIITGANPSGLLEGALDALLYALWQWSLTVFGIMTLAALGGRPLAARRSTLAGREGGLAMLRVYEAAGCVGLAAGLLLYGITLVLDGAGNAGFLVTSMVTFALGFIFRARRLFLDNRDRLETLRSVNSISD